jgi:3-demethoxyubiquinol 3-hydroxylase
MLLDAWHDRFISMLDNGLRTLCAPARAARPSPAAGLEETGLTQSEKKTSVALMRVNHAGEVCAQALYLGQACFSRAAETQTHLTAAAGEEHDHLAWCASRLDELGGRPSLLNPLWFAGSALIGMVAGAAGDPVSLGFVGETERQVEAHLTDHLQRLPDNDLKSHAILERMREDEAQHGVTAERAGADPLPAPVRRLMSVGGGALRRIALVV